MPATPPPSLSTLPAAPDRGDRATFSSRATAMFTALKDVFVGQINAITANVYSNAQLAETAATAAGNSATSAGTSATSAASNATAAGTSATSAATSATNAAGSASAAATSAINASTSAAAAAASALDAGGYVASVNAAATKATPVDADVLGFLDSEASLGLVKLTFANLSAWIAGIFVSRTSATVDGNLTLTGAGRRVTADFSNATVPNRAMLQTSVVNGATNIRAIPNGTGGNAVFQAGNTSDPANQSIGSLAVGPTEVGIYSTATGTGAVLPLSTYVGALKNTEQPATGGFLVLGGVLGYGAGSGGTVTQATSKSTAVTLNKPSGQITMNAASLAAGAAAEFQLNNSFITTGSVVVPAVVAYPSYTVLPKYTDTGFCVLRVVNLSAGALAEPLVINFAVERVSAS